MQPEIILGLLMGGAVIYWFTGAFFFVVALIFVFRSSNGMRIPEEK